MYKSLLFLSHNKLEGSVEHLLSQTLLLEFMEWLNNTGEVGRPVIVKDLMENKEYYFSSVQSASKEINCDQSSIKADRDKPLKGRYLFDIISVEEYLVKSLPSFIHIS